MDRPRHDVNPRPAPRSRPGAPREGGDGVLVIDKPVGPTSHDIVALARRALGTSRVGHTGTLDPNASGVLPLVLGRATRLAQFLSGREKEYIAAVRFGVSSDTYDAVGTVVRESGMTPSASEVEAALQPFRGTFEQVPPPHSAKKVAGVRAYAHARAARPVQLQAVAVTVTRLELLEMQGAEASLLVECSAGFYVRSLAHDLGERLGSGAILAALRRTRAGAFTLDHAIDVATLTERPDETMSALISMDGLLPEIPAAHLTPEGVRRARHGQAIRPEDLSPAVSGPAWPAASVDPVRLIDPSGHLVGVARPGAVAGTLHPSLILV
jgi:tRNA pseudouridine55 synthase